MGASRSYIPNTKEALGKFGLELTQRNWRILNAFSEGGDSWVNNDDGDVPVIAAKFTECTGRQVCVVDLPEIESREQMLEITGVVSDKHGTLDPDKWRQRDAVLVARKIDAFVSEGVHQDRKVELNEIGHVLGIAERYAPRGTVVTMEGDDFKTLAQQSSDIYFINKLLLDFAAGASID